MATVATIDPRYHSLVTAVVVALVLLAVLISVGVAFAWQETRAAPEATVIYGVEEALEYVYPRLTEQARVSMRRSDVRRILAWELKYLQTRPLRRDADEPTVVGGINAARYAQEQLLAEGASYDGPLILEVLDLQAEYLHSLGAVGDPVGGSERDTVLRDSGEDSDE